MRNILKGIPGAEGPCVTRDGRVFMVGPSEGRVIEVLSDGTGVDIANTGGAPTGLQVDQENDLWIADSQLGILRMSLDGRIYLEVTQFNGEKIRGCNDCYFDSRGNLYFSAPVGSDASTPVGEVFCRLHSGEVLRLDDGYAFSNGLAVTIDDRTLIVAETFTRNLYAYDLVEPGVARNKRLWATLPEGGLGPDGMDFDHEGRLLVAYFGGGSIEVFLPDGSWSHRIEVPARDVTNVHFSGPGSSTLLITEMSNGGLWESEYSGCGQMQYGWREKHIT